MLGNGLHVVELEEWGSHLQLTGGGLGFDLCEERARLGLLPLQHLTRGGAFGVRHELQPLHLLPHLLSHLKSHGLKLLRLHAAVRAHNNDTGFRNVGSQQLQPHLQR